jgi:hypothetical protein
MAFISIFAWWLVLNQYDPRNIIALWLFAVFRQFQPYPLSIRKINRVAACTKRMPCVAVHVRNGDDPVSTFDVDHD